MTTPRKPTKKKATAPAKAKTADGPDLERALKRIAATAASDGHTSMRHVEATVQAALTDGHADDTAEAPPSPYVTAMFTSEAGLADFLWIDGPLPNIPVDFSSTAGVVSTGTVGSSLNPGWHKIEGEMTAGGDLSPSEEVSKGDTVVYTDDEGNEWWATITEVFANGTANLRVPGMGAAQVANGVPFAWEAGHPGTWVASDGKR